MRGSLLEDSHLKNNTTRNRLLATSFIVGASFAPMAATVVGSLALMATPASAQDYSSGSLLGTVVSASGAGVSGAKVVVTSTSLGFQREFTTGADGQFRVPLIPIGSYTVSIVADGYESLANSKAEVSLGGSSNYKFSMKAIGAVEELVVTGTRTSRQLDFEATTTGGSYNIAQLVKSLPVARTVEAIAMLAPSVTMGSSSSNSSFASAPSMSGASVAENAYYVNGLNVTNFNNYIGASTVPFDFYQTVEVKTGGYSAEFGRATGGVINSVTKSGTNEFHAAVHGNWEPDALASDSPDTYRTANHLRESEQRSFTVEGSGPIIKDHLFFYGLGQIRDNESHSASITGSQLAVDKTDSPFYGIKLDGLITDRQRLEFTLFDTTRETLRDSYKYSNATGKDVIGTSIIDQTKYQAGGKSYVGKYTGTFTDWLTVSAAYGVTKDRDNAIPKLAFTPYVADIRSGTSKRISQQTSNSNDFPQNTKREFFRADADLYFKLFGDHHIRTGFEEERLTLQHITGRTGGKTIYYLKGSARDTRGVAAGQDYVEYNYFSTGGTFQGNNKALYLQDSWDVNNRLTLNLGVRRDQFSNKNAAGDTFVEFNNEIAPRIGVTYDVFGDKTTKVYANFGRYYLPVAANTAYRQGAAELYFKEYYNAPAGGFVIDPITGVPASVGSLITKATNPGFATAAACPAGGTTAVGLIACNVTSNGTVLPTIAAISRNLKSTFEDEFIFGIERELNASWKVGAVVHSRKLGRASEDSAIDAAVNAYCVSKGIAGCDGIWDGFHQYVIINPGEPSTIVLRDPLPGETTVRTVNFSPAQMHYPKPKREYLALELNFERAFDGKWGVKGSYVISKSQGNYEGFVKSDVGQTDAGITTDFDQPGLVDNAAGLLPNHHAHVFKAYGTYALTDNLELGANVSVISPKKFGCIGVHPTDVFAQVYGAASWFCQGKATPRGQSFESDWTKKVDLSVRYTVPSSIVPMEGNLVLRADVFNLFNSKAVTDAYEFGDLDSGAVDPNYQKTTSYQTPRYVRLGFDMSF